MKRKAEQSPAGPSAPPKKIGAEPPTKFDEYQQELINKAMEGKNVMGLGVAGSGKSSVMKQLRSFVERQGKMLVVVAPMARTATTIMGTTIHSAFGITPNAPLKPLYLTLLDAKGKRGWNKMRRVDAVMCDEVGQVHKKLLWLMDMILRAAKWGERNSTKEKSKNIDDLLCSCNDRVMREAGIMLQGDRRNVAVSAELERVLALEPAFGGVQFMAFGDYLQLPPIPMETDREKRRSEDVWNFNYKHFWAIFSRENIVFFRKVYRQTDKRFLELLEDIRNGTKTPRSAEMLAHLARPFEARPALTPEMRRAKPVYIFPTNKGVGEMNEQCIRALTGPSHTYNGSFCPMPPAGINSDHARIYLENAAAQIEKDGVPEVTLKSGMLVMLTSNLDPPMLVNGSLGTVTGFRDFDLEDLDELDFASTVWVYMNKRASDGRDMVTVRNPHTDKEMEVPRIARFEKRWGKSMSAYEAMPRVVLNMGALVRGIKIPVVKFHCGIERPILPIVSMEMYGDEVVYSMWSMPLIVSYAMSIHRMQGLQVSKAVIDGAKFFGPSQGYVSLSRLFTPEGCLVKNMNDKTFFTDAKARRFMKWGMDGFPSPEEEEADMMPL